MISFIIFFCIQFAAFKCQTGGSITNKMEPPPPDIIKKYGYPVETHTVTTKDGYILTIYRIPYGKNCTADGTKGVVFLQHGLFASSADWVILGPKKGLGFILADACYDVWIMNSRGTDYSQKHETLIPTKTAPSKYWNFDWHEMGLYDLPAVTDYILEKTGVEKLLYIGHSQGTTQALVASIFHKDLKDKILAYFLLAPIAYLKHSTNLFLQALSKVQVIIKSLPLEVRFAANEGALGLINDLTCPTGIICTNAVFFEGGYDPTQIENSDIPTINHYAPADISFQQALHYFDLFNNFVFRQYNYGEVENLKRYGSPEPPEYRLEDVNIPVYAYVGPSDTLTRPIDRDRLFSRINQTLVKVTIIDKLTWDHNDFLYAKEGYRYCYSRVIEDMDDALELLSATAA